MASLFQEVTSNIGNSLVPDDNNNPLCPFFAFTCFLIFPAVRHSQAKTEAQIPQLSVMYAVKSCLDQTQHPDQKRLLPVYVPAHIPSWDHARRQADTMTHQEQPGLAPADVFQANLAEIIKGLCSGIFATPVNPVFRGTASAFDNNRKIIQVDFRGAFYRLSNCLKSSENKIGELSLAVIIKNT